MGHRGKARCPPCLRCTSRVLHSLDNVSSLIQNSWVGMNCKKVLESQGCTRTIRYPKGHRGKKSLKGKANIPCTHFQSILAHTPGTSVLPILSRRHIRIHPFRHRKCLFQSRSRVDMSGHSIHLSNQNSCCLSIHRDTNKSLFLTDHPCTFRWAHKIYKVRKKVRSNFLRTACSLDHSIQLHRCILHCHSLHHHSCHGLHNSICKEDTPLQKIQKSIGSSLNQ
mmetsp:Transcript_29771/g.76882  ORF Transcript_29771/g.76882 Transcript_29771/m.76882 type:complete len:223 (-) Transcript_29771:699-1367(-)